MKCRDLGSLLSMEDLDARLDRAAAGDHLAACPRCARRWPEVAMLVGVTAQRARRRRPAAIAASLAAAAVLGIALTGTASRAKPDRADAGPPPARAITRPERATMVSTASHETISFDRGHRFESRITHAVWTAPTPKCLKAGGSGP